MNLTEAQKAIETILAEVYKCGYEEGRCKGYKNRCIEEEFQNTNKYEDGLNDAWELARRIVCLPQDGGETVEWLENTFGSPKIDTVLRDYSASEAINRVKKHEEIKVGDEVIYDREKCVVTAIANGGYTVMLLGLGGGYMVRTTRDRIQGKRTGRCFPEIVNMLKQMQEGEE